MAYHIFSHCASCSWKPNLTWLTPLFWILYIVPLTTHDARIFESNRLSFGMYFGISSLSYILGLTAFFQHWGRSGTPDSLLPLTAADSLFSAIAIDWTNLTTTTTTVLPLLLLLLLLLLYHYYYHNTNCYYCYRDPSKTTDGKARGVMEGMSYCLPSTTVCLPQLFACLN